MPDPRFFEDLGPVTLAELASLTGAELSDADQGQRQVRGVAVLASAQADTVTFLTDKKYAADLAAAKAAYVAIFIFSDTPSFAEDGRWNGLAASILDLAKSIVGAGFSNNVSRDGHVIANVFANTKIIASKKLLSLKEAVTTAIQIDKRIADIQKHQVLL